MNDVMKIRIPRMALLLCLAFGITFASRGQDSEDTEVVEKAYLGVYVEGVSDVLSSQLGLEEGVGVVVEGLVAGGSAESAGLKKNDILLRFDDQILIGTKQVVVLVRNSEVGSEHEVTLLRAGKEQTITVVLKGKKMPKRSKEEQSSYFHAPMPPEMPNAEELHVVAMKALADVDMPDAEELREVAMRALADVQGQDFDFQFRDEDQEKSFTRRMEWNERKNVMMERLKEAEKHESAVSDSRVVIHGKEHVFEFVDEEGRRFVITDKKGKRRLTILDVDGKETYAGDLTEEAKEMLPESVKSRLPQIQRVVSVRLEAPVWSSSETSESF